MVVTCKKCGEKYVSIFPISLTKGFSEKGLIAGAKKGKTQTEGTIKECSKCRKREDEKNE